MFLPYHYSIQAREISSIVSGYQELNFDKDYSIMQVFYVK